jgi:hypothetical protein
MTLLAVDALSTSIASVALLVSVVSAGFQIYAWRRDRSTRPDVRVSARFVHPSGEHVVYIELVNHSNHEVAVTHVSFMPQKPGDNFLYIPRPLPVEEPIPIVIPPRRSKAVWVLRETLAEKLDLDQPVRAHVSTDDRLDFDSPATLLDRPPTEDRLTPDKTGLPPDF